MDDKMDSVLYQQLAVLRLQTVIMAQTLSQRMEKVEIRRSCDTDTRLQQMHQQFLQYIMN